MKKAKKLVLFFAVILAIICLSVLAVSAENNSKYPYIFVPGMCGWGQYDELSEESPYFGGRDESGNKISTLDLLADNGYEAYCASVGPFSSCWDRACELYAELTGTVVDYGEAHSSAHNHERYGISYENEPLMGKAWDGKTKLNLVGHSFGGETIRLFASLLAYGDADEISATGDNTSPLFTGGNFSIHSITTLSSPHNGSPVSNIVIDTKLPFLAISIGLNVIGAVKGDDMFGIKLSLSQFGLTPKQGEEKSKFSPKAIKAFYSAKDNCGYDLTIAGARELNEKIRIVESTYYYSYSSYVTTVDALGYQTPDDSVSTSFKITSKIIGMLKGLTFDGVKMEGDWLKNDGVVPLMSGKYPFSDEDNAFSYEDSIGAGDTIVPGRWYYMEPIFGLDHGDYCTAKDYPTSYSDFYLSLVDIVNSK